MDTHIIESAKRCLQCKKPRCREHCPIKTPIPQMIQMFLNGSIKDAGDMLFKNNPLSVVCSLVCPHESQCEGNCILGNKGEPVQISSIEHYISNYYLNSMNLRPAEPKGRQVGIIGSGPAGITIAFLLALKGYRITIFEAHDKIGGVLRYGIPEFRLPKTIMDKMQQRLFEMGVKIRPNTMIGKIISIDDLFQDGYEALFIGTGVWRPNRLRIKGESLGHVHFAIDYLKNPAVYQLGERVCVIGAGNVAMDAARTAIRNGAREVYILYRQGREDMTARQNEIQFAEIDGVHFEFYKTPLEFTHQGVRYLETKRVEVETEQGPEQVTAEQEGFLKADSVIVAVSQLPRDIIVGNTKAIDVNGKGLIITDEYGRTTREGVFASGDVVTGARTVVEAARVSKNVAQAIDEYLSNK
ncbi:FAD-dependent pyridine nucleotide-disulfide oxidoreductase [Desulforamulus reducens MI-1]|uniref:FAD-dependent pyridine nucleotide-disulfide oxidoreductase n=1 Tax=Desulforamulus reducens (strain ATCC BAA-1160 / DSM 100696 / MI-1) TaxID=349161 RepID=A4J8R9_DESRM|nr:NAD(P)-dependent oxidoreductase [Desulforamulus reducens]ABO51472.1 FAD-dependent pyridine nucleotide-disulfide oxidoreductase [Desulforamulus reducens MI-1]